MVGGGVGGCGKIIVSTPEMFKLVAQPSGTERTTWPEIGLISSAGMKETLCPRVHARNSEQ